jgi:hypothetical protein
MTSILRVDVINNIIKEYNKENIEYLEIGVWDAKTFRYVNSNNKDGVDPGQYCDCSYVNYKMTSDEFFNNHITKKYDIVFIDGLHTAYQVSKDIYNSINNLKDGGWIILDDVFPHSEYEQERLNLRKHGPQTGDVWKAIYHVFDDIIEMSDVIYFTTQTERGSLAFKLKSNNTKNIVIDNNIPTCNEDGWYDGNDAEWNKYTYKKDFAKYLEKVNMFVKIF